MLLCLYIKCMEQDLLERQVTGKIYSIRTIVVSSLFGGFLASSYMLYRNFIMLEEKSNAKRTIVITIAVLIFLMFTTYIPALDKIPGILYSFFLTIATSFIAKKVQEDKLITFVNEGGEHYSTGHSVLVCILSFIALIAITAGLYLITQFAY